MNCLFGTTCYTLTKEQVQRSALLTEMLAICGGDEVQLQCDEEFFLVAYRYLTEETLPTERQFAAIDYFGIKPYETYELSLVREKAMRAKMYAVDVDDSSVQESDPNEKPQCPDDGFLAEAYGLHIIDRHFWETFAPKRRVTPQTLFVGPEPVKADWSAVEQRLATLHEFTNGGNVFVAGGCIFSILFGLPVADIDLFYFGLTSEQASEKLLAFRPSGRPNVLRTKNAVTYYFDRKEMIPEVQVILRLYQTKAEIISGFDVCSCCLGYDGKSIYATTRALYALENLVNTVSFDLLSPTYERRLAKYAARGIAVEVPGFDRALVNEQRLALDLLTCSALFCDEKSTGVRYRHLAKKSPLDTLLYLEKHLEQYAYADRSRMMVKNFAGEISDYAAKGSANVYTKATGHQVGDLIDYLSNTEEDDECSYNDKIRQYQPIIVELTFGQIGAWQNLWITNPFYAKRISYIRAVNGEDPCKALVIDERLYQVLSILRPVDFTREVEWKTTRPGEQMTNTFHSLVLEDKSVWYNGTYYNNATEVWGDYARPWRVPLELYSLSDLLGEETNDDELREQLYNLFTSVAVGPSPALLSFIAEQGIQKYDILYFSNTKNKSQVPLVWNGRELFHPLSCEFDFLQGKVREDYWKKALYTYVVRAECRIVVGVVTLPNSGATVEIPKYRDFTGKYTFQLCYTGGYFRIWSFTIQHRVLKARRDKEERTGDSLSKIDTDDSDDSLSETNSDDSTYSDDTD